MPVWYLWPHTLHDRFPKPSFLSSLITTEFSWLQNRHAKVVGRGSFYSVLAEACAGDRRNHLLRLSWLAAGLLSFALFRISRSQLFHVLVYEPCLNHGMLPSRRVVVLWLFLFLRDALMT